MVTVTYCIVHFIDKVYGTYYNINLNNILFIIGIYRIPSGFYGGH